MEKLKYIRYESAELLQTVKKRSNWIGIKYNFKTKLKKVSGVFKRT